MPEYVWKARTTAGNILSGEMNEVNESVVMTKLRKMNYTDIKVKKKPKDLFENIEFFQPKVKTKDIVIFTRQFATMIDAGLPLVQCLEILAGQQENKTFKKVLTSVKLTVEGGSTFADALKAASENFRRPICQLDSCWRSRRHTGHNIASACRVSGKSRSIEA